MATFAELLEEEECSSTNIRHSVDHALVFRRCKLLSLKLQLMTELLVLEERMCEAEDHLQFGGCDDCDIDPLVWHNHLFSQAVANQEALFSVTDTTVCLCAMHLLSVYMFRDLTMRRSSSMIFRSR